MTLLASTAFAAGGALGADRNGTQYTYVIGYMYSGSSQTINTREIFTSPNNYDVWPVSYTHLDVYKRQPERLNMLRETCDLSKALNRSIERALDLRQRSKAKNAVLTR